jgi:hypothetical protein
VKTGFVFLFLLLLVIAVLFVGLAPWQEKIVETTPPVQTPPSHTILLETSGRAIEGGSISVFATSSCGEGIPIALHLDGKSVGEQIGARATFPLSNLAAGEHELSASSGECIGSLSLLVSPASCNEGEKMPCEINGCAGIRLCENGILTECNLPKKICIPGSVTGCSLDSCSFGYTKCNECGNGFGPCMPSPQIAGSLTSCP